MKKNKKINLLSAQTDEVTYRNELIRLLLVILIFNIAFFINIHIQKEVTLQVVLIILRLLNVLVVFSGLLLILISFLRLINVSNNREMILKNKANIN